MKRCFTGLKILFSTVLLLWLFLVFTANAQRINTPDGEAVLRVVVFDYNGSEYRIVATQYSVYSSTYINGEGWDENNLLYMSPSGIRITDINILTGETGKNRTVFILLNNGKYIKAVFNSAKRIFEGALISESSNITQTGTYKKIFAGTKVYLFQSSRVYENSEDGNGWSQDSSGLSGATVSDIYLAPPIGLVAATNRGLFSISENDTIWKKITAFDSTGATPSSVFFSKNSYLYCGSSKNGPYYSTNLGSTWIHDTTGMGNLQVVKFGDDNDGTTFAICSYSGYNILYRKPIAAKSWERIDTNLFNYLGFYTTINDVTGGLGLEVATSYSLYSSENDGINWFPSYDGIWAEDIYGLQFLPDGKVICSTGFGIFTKQSGNEKWIKTYPVGYFTSGRILKRDNSNNLFTTEPIFGTASHQPYSLKSTDEGDTWNYDTLGINSVPYGSQYATSFFVDENSGQHFGLSATTSIPYRAYLKKNGQNWVIDTTGFNASPNKNSTQFKFFTTFGSNLRGTVYAAEVQIDSSRYNLANVYKKTPEVPRWQYDTLGIYNVPMSAFIPDKNGVMYSGSLSKGIISAIYKRTTYGWAKLKVPPAASADVNYMSFDSTNRLYVYFGSLYGSTYKGIYSTTDDGNSWLYAGFDSVSVRGFACKGDTMFAFTTRGAYKLTSSTLNLPVMNLSLKDIDFGKVQEYKSRDTVLSITNTGEDTLRVFNITSSNSAFTPSIKAFTVAPGNIYYMILKFSPSKSGAVSGLLRFYSNAYPDSVIVRGEGADFQYPAMTLSTKSIDFGEVKKGEQKDSTVNIINSGQDTLFVYNVRTSQSSFQPLETTFVVVPGDTVTLKIRFTPQSNAYVSSYIRISGNVPADTVVVVGKGTGFTEPKILLGLSSIDFGIVEVGKTKDTLVTVSNPGTDTLKISNIKSSSSVFKINPTLLKIEPDSTRKVEVSFEPVSNSYTTAKIQFFSNTNTDSILVSGSGDDTKDVTENPVITINEIYPNPSSGNIILTMNVSSTTQFKVMITDMRGNEISSVTELNAETGAYRLNIDFPESMANGCYLLKILNGQETTTKPVILLR